MKKKIKEDLNEILLSLYIFLPTFLLPFSVLFGVKVYKVVFITANLIMFALSIWKTRKILIKKDLLLLGIILFLLAIDFVLRKNSYTISSYLTIFKMVIIPCYYFNRTSNDYSKILMYLSYCAKLAIIMFAFDPLLFYFFTETYMGYGYGIIMPSFIAIYLYHLIRKRRDDWIFLILGFIGIIIYSNRMCILSILLLMCLTFGLMRKRMFGKNALKVEKYKTKFKFKWFDIAVVVGLFVFSFVCNFTFSRTFEPKYNNDSDAVAEKAGATKTDTGKTGKDTKNTGTTKDNSGTTTTKDNTTKDNSGTTTTKNNNTKDAGTKNNDTKTNTDKSGVVVNNKKGKYNTKTEDKDLNFYSYAIDKYKQLFNGKFDKILSSRTIIWGKVIDVIGNTISHDFIHLIFGYGTGYFRSINEGVYTHFIGFDLLIEYGVIGLLLFGALLVYTFIGYGKLYKKNINAFILATFWLTIAFPKLLLSAYFQKETSLFLFMVLVLTIYPNPLYVKIKNTKFVKKIMDSSIVEKLKNMYLSLEKVFVRK